MTPLSKFLDEVEQRLKANAEPRIFRENDQAEGWLHAYAPDDLKIFLALVKRQREALEQIGATASDDDLPALDDDDYNALQKYMALAMKRRTTARTCIADCDRIAKGDK